MSKFFTDFVFGVALGLGLAVSYVVVKLLAWVFTAASHGMPQIP